MIIMIIIMIIILMIIIIMTIIIIFIQIKYKSIKNILKEYTEGNMKTGNEVARHVKREYSDIQQDWQFKIHETCNTTGRAGPCKTMEGRPRKSRTRIGGTR